MRYDNVLDLCDKYNLVEPEATPEIFRAIYKDLSSLDFVNLESGRGAVLFSVCDNVELNLIPIPKVERQTISTENIDYDTLPDHLVYESRHEKFVSDKDMRRFKKIKTKPGFGTFNTDRSVYNIGDYRIDKLDMTFNKSKKMSLAFAEKLKCCNSVPVSELWTLEMRERFDNETFDIVIDTFKVCKQCDSVYCVTESAKFEEHELESMVAKYPQLARYVKLYKRMIANEMKGTD